MDSICVSHLYVGNLPWWATYQDLLEVFSAYGSIRRCTIAHRNHDGYLFGFVTFRDQDSALRALCSTIYLGGRRLAIQVSNRRSPPRLDHPVGLLGTHGSTFGGYDDVDHSQSTRTRSPSRGSRYLPESRHRLYPLSRPGENLESRTGTPSLIVSRCHHGSRDRLYRSPATHDDHRGSDQDIRDGYQDDREGYLDDLGDDRDGDQDDSGEYSYDSGEYSYYSGEYDYDSDDDRADGRIDLHPAFTRYCSRSPLIEYGVRSNLPSSRSLQRSRSHSLGVRSSRQGHDHRSRPSGKGGHRRHRRHHHHRRSSSSDSGDYHKSRRSRARHRK